MRNGLKAPSQIVAERGEDFEAHVRRLAADLALYARGRGPDPGRPDRRAETGRAGPRRSAGRARRIGVPMSKLEIPARLYRAGTVERAGAPADPAVEDDRRVRLSFSSEAPVERMFGFEVLGHRAGEIDLSRLAAGVMPLLADHRATLDNQIGTVEFGRDCRGPGPCGRALWEKRARLGNPRPGPRRRNHGRFRGLPDQQGRARRRARRNSGFPRNALDPARGLACPAAGRRVGRDRARRPRRKRSPSPSKGNSPMSETHPRRRAGAAETRRSPPPRPAPPSRPPSRRSGRRRARPHSRNHRSRPQVQHARGRGRARRSTAA